MIGHNVSFDRSKISEEYNEIESGNIFLDTMSLHISTHGMTTDQRVQYKMKSESKYQFLVDKWKRHSSLNNLADCLNFYCPQEPSIDKSIRNVFVTAKKDEFQKKIVDDFSLLIDSKAPNLQPFPRGIFTISGTPSCAAPTGAHWARSITCVIQ